MVEHFAKVTTGRDVYVFLESDAAFVTEEKKVPSYSSGTLASDISLGSEQVATVWVGRTRHIETRGTT